MSYPPKFLWDIPEQPDFDPPADNIPPLPNITNLTFRLVSVLDYLDHELERCGQEDKTPLHLLGRARTFKVHAEWRGYSGVAVMKLFHGYNECEFSHFDSDDGFDFKDGTGPKIDVDPTGLFSRELFLNETRAYARLRHYGGSGEGSVPKCFGVHYFSDDWKTSHLKHDSDRDSPTSPFHPFFEDANPPIALLLEFISATNLLTPETLDESLAREIVTCLDEIHKGYVLHCDIHPRNILIKGGKPVLIDFGRSNVYPFGWKQEDLDLYVHGEFMDVYDLLSQMFEDKQRLLEGKEPVYKDQWSLSGSDDESCGKSSHTSEDRSDRSEQELFDSRTDASSATQPESPDRFAFDEVDCTSGINANQIESLDT